MCLLSVGVNDKLHFMERFIEIMSFISWIPAKLHAIDVRKYFSISMSVDIESLYIWSRNNID